MSAARLSVGARLFELYTQRDGYPKRGCEDRSMQFRQRRVIPRPQRAEVIRRGAATLLAGRLSF